jgi:hypothetical protein
MNITLLWTPDIFSSLPSLSTFHLSFLSKQLENETIDFICVARDDNTISTAYSIREHINSRNIYVLPYLTSKSDSFRRKLEDSTWVLKYNKSDHNNNDHDKFTNPFGATKFEEVCLPYIKNLLMVKNSYNVYNTHNISNTSKNSKKPDCTVVIVSDIDFLRQYFSCEIEPGQIYWQKFVYNEFYDIIPSHRKNMPIEQIGKWYTTYSNSINIESFKIFL